jgi:hypothetical protein
MKLHVEWLPNKRQWEGGAYVVMKGNGHVFAFMPTYGRNTTSLRQALTTAYLWNQHEGHEDQGVYFKDPEAFLRKEHYVYVAGKGLTDKVLAKLNKGQRYDHYPKHR